MSGEYEEWGPPVGLVLMGVVVENTIHQKLYMWMNEKIELLGDVTIKILMMFFLVSFSFSRFLNQKRICQFKACFSSYEIIDYWCIEFNVHICRCFYIRLKMDVRVLTFCAYYNH